MRQTLITETYGLIFLLLVGGAVIRAFLREAKRGGAGEVGKRAGKKFLYYLFRIGVTGAAAWAIAVLVADEMAVAVWVVAWPGLYWLWKLWDRWRAKAGAKPSEEAIQATARAIPLAPVAPVEGGPVRPLWRRAVRKTLLLAGGAMALIFVMGAVMILGLGYYERQAQKERDKVKVGMTVEEVLPLVKGSMGVRAHAELPDTMDDPELVHYATLFERDDGTFRCSCAPDRPSLSLNEAAAAMKQRMPDGYEWIWRYTFTNDTPMHFSFSVTFGKDGRVKSVTDVWGWD